MSTGDAAPSPRTLVLCFDGTAKEYTSENSNAVRFFSLLKKDDEQNQLCYYQAGVGTFFAPGAVSPLLEWVAKVADQAFAWYLNTHVMDGYRFLMQNYRRGDRICLFGFSRGAYTARALAGMLHKVGLLQKDNEEQIIFAYKLYKRDDEESIRLSAGFKQTFCRNVQIEFIGAWDTISSIGILVGRTLPFTNSNGSIKTFRHALALDERRARFRPNTFRVVTQAPSSTNIQVSSDPSRKHKHRRKPFSFLRRTGSDSSDVEALRNKEGVPTTVRALTDSDPGESPTSTDALEVWFVGSHSDVGGGAVTNEEAPHSLENITLRWMVQQVQSTSCGVQLDENALQRMEIPPYSSEPTTSGLKSAQSQEGEAGRTKDQETTLDEEEVLLPIHDELVRNKLWWLLEIIPLYYRWQDDKGEWHSSFGFNLGKGRVIDDYRPNFHVTVQQRLKLGYTPKATWKNGSEVYVE